METYTTVQGDMWDLIAKKIYNNEKYTKELMEANTQHLSTAIFSAGVELKIPEIETSIQDSSLPPWRG